MPTIALMVAEGFQDILNLQRLRLRNPLNIFEKRTVALIPRNLVFETPGRMRHDGVCEAAARYCGTVDQRSCCP